MADIPPPPPGFIPISQFKASPEPPPGFVPMSQAEPSMLDKIKQYALSPDLANASKLDPLADIARAGQWANKKVQDFSGKMAEQGGEEAARRGKEMNPYLSPDVWAGTITGTLGDALIPTNRLSAGLTALPALAKGVKLAAGADIPAMFKSAPGKSSELAKGAEEAEVIAPAEAAAALNAAKEAPKIAPPDAVAAATTGAKTPKPGFLAQLIQGRAKISPGMAQYAVDHPDVLGDSTPTIEQATERYAKAIPGLKGKIQSISDRLNKVDISPSDFSDAINRAWRLERGTEVTPTGEVVKMTPQDALEGIQTINQALRDKAYTSTMHPDKSMEFVGLKDRLLDFLTNNGAPNLREAAKDLFKAHVKDAFNDWLPRNKFGSTDALRTMMASSNMAKGVGALLGGASAGYPGAAIGAATPIIADAAMTSPRVAGKLIQELGALKNPATYAPLAKAAVPASNLAGGQPQSTNDQLMSWLRMGNAINPSKSGQYAQELKGLGLPNNLVSGGGKRSIDEAADQYGLTPADIMAILRSGGRR